MLAPPGRLEGACLGTHFQHCIFFKTGLQCIQTMTLAIPTKLDQLRAVPQLRVFLSVFCFFDLRSTIVEWSRGLRIRILPMGLTRNVAK